MFSVGADGLVMIASVRGCSGGGIYDGTHTTNLNMRSALKSGVKVLFGSLVGVFLLALLSLVVESVIVAMLIGVTLLAIIYAVYTRVQGETISIQVSLGD